MKIQADIDLNQVIDILMNEGASELEEFVCLLNESSKAWGLQDELIEYFRKIINGKNI